MAVGDADHDDRNAKPDRDEHPSPVISDLFPRMVATGASLVFLSETGGVSRSIPLTNDTNVQKQVVFSPNHQCALLSQTFLGVPGPEPGKAGELPTTFDVYTASGNRLYSTTGSIDAHPLLADDGRLTIHGEDADVLSFISPSTGATIKTTTPLAKYGVGQLYVAAANGTPRTVVCASTRSLNGQYPGASKQSPPSFLTSGTPELWMAMYDGSGTELWHRKIDGADGVQKLGISDDGNTILLVGTTYRHVAGTEQIASEPYLVLNADGSVRTESETAHAGHAGITYDSATRTFLLGDPDFPPVGLLYENGAFGEAPQVAEAKGTILARDLKGCMQAILTTHENHALLLLICPTGQLLARLDVPELGRSSAGGDNATAVGQFFVRLAADCSRVAVSGPSSMRLYKITPKNGDSDDRDSHERQQEGN